MMQLLIIPGHLPDVSGIARHIHRLAAAASLIRDSLGHHSAADRLLINMLNYAAKGKDNPLAGPAGDFAAALKTFGYPPAKR